MNFGTIIIADCENTVVPPTSDPRCDDPAFRLLNPTICNAAPVLIIKPSSGLVCLYGSIQFKAFLVSNNAETDVTDGSVFTSSNPDVVIIGAKSGNATGLSAGTAIITATYQGMTAQADITALGEANCCDEQVVAMLVLIDTSKSMSQAFNGTYATKLDYAKAAARRFIGEVNEQKDLIGLMTFNAATSTLLATPIHDKISVRDQVDNVTQTVESTSFYAAINNAIATLADVTADRKVLVIMSDGVDENVDYSVNNPISLTDDFKNAGNIVICLGVRAAAAGFTLLDLFSSGGLFVNGYNSTDSQALDILSGLKGYFCAGNCTPEGDSFEPTPALDYTTLTNWDILSGTIDLVGTGLFDVLPGNGLYLAFDANECVIQSKDSFSFEAGKTYRIRVYVAGNQKMDNGAATVKVEIGSIFSHTISIADFAQGFANNSFNFTPSVDASEKIKITSDIGDPSIADWGPLLDAVTLTDVTDNTLMFSDSFDTENSQYVPPRCGIGTTYTTAGYVTAGYEGCYGEGCLTEPPGAQLPDPNALPDIEAGYVPPTTYSSTKTACVTCPAGSTNVSGVNIVPTMTSDTAPSGAVSASSALNFVSEFWAFDGVLSTVWHATGSLPQWIQYQFAANTLVGAYSITSAKALTETSPVGVPTSNPKAWLFQGSSDGINWTTLDSQSGITWFPNEEKLFAVASPQSFLYYRIRVSDAETTGLPTISCSIAVIKMFAPPETQACATASATSTISQADADAQATDAATTAAQAQLNCQPSYTSTESYTATCPAGSFGTPVTRSATATSFNSQEEADASALAAATADAEDALDCTLSNNTNTVTILDNGPANPYPSVEYVSGLTGKISKVTVALNKLSHTWPDDLIIALMHPDGTKVLLMANCGGSFAITDVDLVFDDDAGSALPDATLITSGTYTPTAFFPVADFVLPMPGSLHPGDFETTLASLIGKDPNGPWAVYVLDDSAGNTGQILNGYELTITTA